MDGGFGPLARNLQPGPRKGRRITRQSPINTLAFFLVCTHGKFFNKRIPPEPSKTQNGPYISENVFFDSYRHCSGACAISIYSIYNLYETDPDLEIGRDRSTGGQPEPNIGSPTASRALVLMEAGKQKCYVYQ